MEEQEQVKDDDAGLQDFNSTHFENGFQLLGRMNPLQIPASLTDSKID